MSYRIEFIPAVVVVGLVMLLCVPGLSLLIALVILTVAAMALLALVGALLASPYLLIRSVCRRWQARAATDRSRRPADGRLAGMGVENRIPTSALLSSASK
jgi:protein-S-isoprenylcysteine O-methyltransferase Ste14